MNISDVKLIAPPQSGQVAIKGPSFSYTAKPDFQGEDDFTPECQARLLGCAEYRMSRSPFLIGALFLDRRPPAVTRPIIAFNIDPSYQVLRRWPTLRVRFRVIDPGFPTGAKFSACQSTAILRVPMPRPPEVDDDSVDPAVAAHDDVQDPSHVLPALLRTLLQRIVENTYVAGSLPRDGVGR
jgi:hypothetical protein